MDFQIQHDVKQFGDTVVGFGHKGAMAEPDTFKSYAKIISNDVGTRYFIRMDANCSMFDPNNATLSPASRMDTLRGKEYWAYTRTNKDVFDLYMKFLKTNNELYLHNAEAIQRNGISFSTKKWLNDKK